MIVQLAWKGLAGTGVYQVRLYEKVCKKSFSKFVVVLAKKLFSPILIVLLEKCPFHRPAWNKFLFQRMLENNFDA